MSFEQVQPRSIDWDIDSTNSAGNFGQFEYEIHEKVVAESAFGLFSLSQFQCYWQKVTF